MSSPAELLIFGTGTIAEMAYFYFSNDSPYDVVAFVQRDEESGVGRTLLGKPIVSWSEAVAMYPAAEYCMFIAIGYKETNSIRQARFEQARAAGYVCASYVSSRCTNYASEIGSNCFILEANVLQPFTKVGNNVTMWSGNHLGHHSSVHDHAFISSHVVISGKCCVGANSFLGVNSCLHDGVTLGPKSVVGAGAVVSKSCESRSVFVPPKTSQRIITRDVI